MGKAKPKSSYKRSMRRKSWNMRRLQRERWRGLVSFPEVARAEAAPPAAIASPSMPEEAHAHARAAVHTAGPSRGTCALPAFDSSPVAGPSRGDRALGAAASTPVRGRDMYAFDAGSATPIRPWRVPRRSLQDLPEEPDSPQSQLVPPPPVEGNRIILYSEFINQIQADRHGGGLDCSFMDCEFVKETRFGFRSRMHYRCRVCKKATTLLTGPEESNGRTMEVNKAAVSGTVACGGTHATLSTIAAGLNMPCMTRKIYHAHENLLTDVVDKVSLESMLVWGAKERRLAIEAGDVDPRDGTPFITVVADGMWSKRSYKNKYDAKSGTATIIGFRTNKILWQSTRNKSCAVCDFAAKNKRAPRDHTCARNYVGSSTGMEAEIVAEGFQSSMDMHGLRFTKLIGDGDSSVYTRLVLTKPYGALHLVEKVECKNHLLRNFRGALITLGGNTKVSVPEGVSKDEMCLLRKVIRENANFLALGISKACTYRGKTEKDVPRGERVRRLRADILNAPAHKFGEHALCADYFCRVKQAEKGLPVAPERPTPPGHTMLQDAVRRLQRAGLWTEVMLPVNRLADKASSLVYNVTNNGCEMANSVVAKLIGGKKKHLSRRRSFGLRCLAAAVSLNTSGQLLGTIHKEITGASPGKHLAGHERIQKAAKESTRRHRAQAVAAGTAWRRRPPVAAGPDDDYGLNVPGNEPPPADDQQTLETKMAEVMHALQQSLGRLTELQEMAQNTNEWYAEREMRLTASNFGDVCKRRPTTSCKALVRRYVHGSKTSGDGKSRGEFDHGHTFEPVARDLLSQKLGQEVRTCGLFIDEEMPYLGASPDGLIGNDTVVEIKCPFKAYRTQSLEQAIADECIDYITIDDSGEEYALKENHNYYFQVQGQMHISKRDKCLFMLYTDKWFKVIKIRRDDAFWEKNMRVQLKTFYEKCLLPEIAMPRYLYRRLDKDIREPQHILDAMAAQAEARAKAAQPSRQENQARKGNRRSARIRGDPDED